MKVEKGASYYKNSDASSKEEWVELYGIQESVVSLYPNWREGYGKLSIEFSLLWDRDDKDFCSILKSAIHDKRIALMFLDTSSSDGGQGIQGNFKIERLLRKEKLIENMVVVFSAAPCERNPEIVWIDK